MSRDKADSGKLDLTIVPPQLAESVARVLAFGARKYARDGYLSVPGAPHRYYQALLRHLHAFDLGEDVDPETGEHHLAHVGANVAILLRLIARGDDVGGWRS